MSDKSIIELTNREFIYALFGDRIAQGESVWTCQFPQDPAFAQGSWKGQIWRDGNDNGSSIEGLAENHYFSITSFNSDHGRRSRNNAAAVTCLILDDVGTKVVGEELLPVPSWAIETSPGNFQFGYAFSTPLTDIKSAEKIFKALAKKHEVSDPGGHNIVRYARLPVGFNTKEKYRKSDGSYPATKLHQWNPGIRYTPENISEALGLNLDEGSHKKSNSLMLEEVFQDSFTENPVLVKLKSAGLYKSEKNSGVHEITCPWRNEHTDQADNGTAYLEPTKEHPYGGFKCHHGHCAQRKLRHFLNHLGVDKTVAMNLPIIRAVQGELHQVVESCELILRRAGYYRNGSMIISVITQDTSQGDVVSTQELDEVSAAVELTRHARWLRYDARSGGWVPMDVTQKYALAVIKNRRRGHLQQIRALSRQPFLRADGSVCAMVGYDPQSEIYAAFDPEKFPLIKEVPGREDALAALGLLEDLLAETPFKSCSDKSAALCMFLSAAVRPTLPTCPGFLVNAHAIGSGKSYLLDQAGAFATADSHLPSAAFIANDIELRKELLAKLLEAPAAIKWDEMTKDLEPVAALNSALTSETIEGRKLKLTQMIKVSTRTLMMFAGNNVYPVNDMSRRIISINLDPPMEDPATREFKRDHLGELRAQRGRYVMAALTIILAWLAAGKPKAPNAKSTVNSFDLWSDWCRQPLLWLDYPDPATSLFESLKSDPGKEELSRVMEAWDGAFGHYPTSVKQAVKKCENDDTLRDVLLEVAEARFGEIDRKKLGWYLKKNIGRWVNGRRFEKDESNIRNANFYRLGFTDDYAASDNYVGEKKSLAVDPISQPLTAECCKETDNSIDFVLTQDPRNYSPPKSDAVKQAQPMCEDKGGKKPSVDIPFVQAFEV